MASWDPGFSYKGDYGEEWSINGDSRSRIHLPGMANTYLCPIYDSGSRLEMAVWEEEEQAKTLGYVSATYTGSGTTRTVTITDVSSSAESIAGGLKDKSQPLTYEADTKTYTIKK